MRISGHSWPPSDKAHGCVRGHPKGRINSSRRLWHYACLSKGSIEVCSLAAKTLTQRGSSAASPQRQPFSLNIYMLEHILIWYHHGAGDWATGSSRLPKQRSEDIRCSSFVEDVQSQGEKGGQRRTDSSDQPLFCCDCEDTCN